MKRRILVVDIGGSFVKLLMSKRVEREFASGPRMTPKQFVTQFKETARGWKFDVAVTDQSVRLLVVIGAPNRTLQTFDVPAAAEELQYEVASRGGTLDLRFGTSADASFMLTRNGVEVPFPSLLSWVIAHGAPIEDQNNLRVMDLAPGQYRACGGSGQCVDGVLAPGATLELRVPE